jgi:hypothetical protein
MAQRAESKVAFITGAARGAIMAIRGLTERHFEFTPVA